MTPSRIAALWLLAAAAASAQDLGLPLAATGRTAVETGLDLAASALAGALRHSRDQARAEGTLPMPPRIREALLDWYPADLLDGITYRIGTTETATVQSFSIRYGEATAVAAIDTITFADPWDAENNIALWGHEVKHVEQFRAWGVYGFARRYLRDHDAVERDAYAIGAALKALHGGG
ncbi:DUF4157 domain-containing protein [Tabrizicola sp.]|uniref:DUF4157 domain-containing protein n=1 Tax=Tabrizicola sp. TaxID=2005166 RepID=UPI0035AF9417